MKNITDSILYIGVDDTDIDLFEGQYTVQNGVSYNSYLIKDEKIAIMDSVDKRKSEAWLANLDTALGGKTPDYIIVSHLEPDHASSLSAVLDKYPSLVPVLNAKTLTFLPQFTGKDYSDRALVVKEGDELSLGSHSLKFVMAPMVHWPEVMVTYELSEKILFSADGFGTFGALSSGEAWEAEAGRYYFNIVGKYGAQVQALLKKAAALDIAVICPLHGPWLTENLSYYIGKYDTWSKYESDEDGVFIAYASMHGNTAEAAIKLCDALLTNGAKNVVLHDLARDDMADAVEDAFRYDKLVLASPTYDGGISPYMEDFLYHLVLKNFRNKRIALIENGTWAPMAAKKMTEHIEKMANISLCKNTVTIRSSLNSANAEQLDALARELLG